MEIKDIASSFKIKGNIIDVNVIKTGHINDTYKVDFSYKKEVNSYIIQRMNKYVFKNPASVMNNIAHVTLFIRKELEKKGIDTSRSVLNFLYTSNKRSYFIDDKDNYWRCYEFITNSTTFDSTSDLGLIEETGRAFGEFQNYLSYYDAASLNITIPHFHNTVNRYLVLKESIKNNKADRFKDVQEIVMELLSLEDTACELYLLQRKGLLPLRVTHNDTKANNVLFDKDSLKSLCVIDLDTVMPGLVAHDFGDAIRFIANTKSEDEKDISTIKIDLSKFEAFTKGFLKEVKDSLTDKEKETLSLGAISMTVELATRFLADYLDGDIYFKTDYKNHNLDRAISQLALAKDMIKHKIEMDEIIKKYL